MSLPNADGDILTLKVMVLLNERPLGVTTSYVSKYTHLGKWEGQKDNFSGVHSHFHNVCSGN